MSNVCALARHSSLPDLPKQSTVFSVVRQSATAEQSNVPSQPRPSSSMARRRGTTGRHSLIVLLFYDNRHRLIGLLSEKETELASGNGETGVGSLAALL